MIGARLAEARRGRGLTVRELAERSGVSYQLVSKVENGGNTTVEHLADMAAALEAELDVQIVPRGAVSLPDVPGDRRPLARRLLMLIPHLDPVQLDLLTAEIALWERRVALDEREQQVKR